MKHAVIVSAARTAVGKAPGGTLRNTRPDDMAAAVIGAVLERAPGVDPSGIEDVIVGCAMPISTDTRESSAPVSRATHAPKENPAAHKGESG